MHFVDLLQKHGVPFYTEGRYCRVGWIQFHCPHCSGGRDQNKPYCGFNRSGGYIHCWRCGPHNLTKTICLLTGMSWKEAKELAPQTEHVRLEDQIVGKLELPKGIGDLQSAHVRYLKSRGFDPEQIEQLWRVQGIGIASKLSWRVFIPIHLKGKVVSWTTRCLTDQEPRYVSASSSQESIPHKKLLYGEDAVANAISIHEGPFDAWAVGPGATATLGTSITTAQTLRMSKYPRRIVCFDNEPEAQARARKLCDSLAVFPGQTYNVTFDSKDAATASKRELRSLRKMLH